MKSQIIISVALPSLFLGSNCYGSKSLFHSSFCNRGSTRVRSFILLPSTTPNKNALLFVLQIQPRSLSSLLKPFETKYPSVGSSRTTLHVSFFASICLYPPLQIFLQQILSNASTGSLLSLTMVYKSHNTELNTYLFNMSSLLLMKSLCIYRFHQRSQIQLFLVILRAISPLQSM